MSTGKPGFVTDLDLRALTPDLWCLDTPLVYVRLDGTMITVPKGCITDLASIPHIVDWIPFLDRTGLSRRPGALHDWAYMGLRSHGKDWCDSLLREALLAEGMSETGANIIYKAVSWFGAGPYAKDGQRHPYATNPANLEGDDFISKEDWEAWMATNPVPNQPSRPA